MINEDEIDYVPEEDNLLYTVDPGLRIFTLNNANSTTLLGILLEETEDSFLVGLPARLMDSEAGMKIEPFMTVPYLRLIKSSVLTLLYPFGVFEEKYVPYVIEYGEDLYPEIVEDLKSNLSETEPLEKESNGMDQEQLKEYLTEKFYTGAVTLGNRTKH